MTESNASSDDDRRPRPATFDGRTTPTNDDRDVFAELWPEPWRDAADALDWTREYDAVLETGAEGGPPFEWFAGGELNASRNCLDRHLPERADNVAVEWNGHLGETRTYTYEDLHAEVNAVAAALRELGVEPDDVVTLLFDITQGPQWAYHLTLASGIVAHWGFFASLDAAVEY